MFEKLLDLKCYKNSVSILPIIIVRVYTCIILKACDLLYFLLFINILGKYHFLILYTAKRYSGIISVNHTCTSIPHDLSA